MTRFAALVLTALLAACASQPDPWSGREVRAAEDTPSEFVTEDGEYPVQSCRSPLIDPRDQTRLRLVRSAPLGSQHRGDYEVPSGRYGVTPGELLRIDCATGQVIGIVRN